VPSFDPARRSLAARAAAATRWGHDDADDLRRQLRIDRTAQAIRAAVRNRLSDEEWFALLSALRDPDPEEVAS
jgi:hypothetical protein